MANPSSPGAEFGGVPAELTLVPGLPVPLRRPGVFPATHPYLEECWTGIIGPTSVLLLRRATLLFQESVPAVIDSGELAASLGLRPARLGYTIERLRHFRLAAWDPGRALAIADRVPPLNDSQLERSPSWVTRRHQLHLDRLAQARAARARTAATKQGGLGPDPNTGPVLGSAGERLSWQHRSDRPSGHPDNCDRQCCRREVPTPPPTVNGPATKPLDGLGPAPGHGRAL